MVYTDKTDKVNLQNYISSHLLRAPCEAVMTIEGSVEKRHIKYLFLTDLCLSWFKMDPARPSYHA